MSVLKNQNIPTKPCPLCQTGKIYSGERGKVLNVKLDGRSVCEDCLVKAMKERFSGGDASEICLSCGNNIGAGEDHWENCPTLMEEE